MDACVTEFFRRSSLDERWTALLSDEWDKPYFSALCRAVTEKRGAATVFPPAAEVFAALNLTAPEAVRCVILGQDPYHEPGQAHGLAFSVAPGVPLPRSLRNIYKELAADLGCPAPESGCLIPWAKAGVLLLNTVLTVEEGRANSHAKLGWQEFTDAVFRALWQLPQPVAFVLWGRQAQAKLERARMGEGGGPRCIVASPHPSPLSASRGFFGSRPSSRVNDFLAAQGEAPIPWSF